MKVIICADVLPTNSNWKHLDQIIHRIDDGAHEWEIDDPQSIEESLWFINSRDFFQELFQKSSVQGVYPRKSEHLPTKCLYVTHISCNLQKLVLAPEPAEKFLKQPLTILVENRFSDRLFGNMAMELFGPPELIVLRNNGSDSLKFDGGGGNGELPKIIDDYIQAAQQSGHPARIVAFTDSDGKVPGEISDNAKRVQKTCSAANIPCQILKKRAIENYIPDEIFNSWKTNHKKIAALLRLSPQQRDHFNMKKGFSSNLKDLPEIERDFYSSVSESDKMLLKTGFGNNVIKLLDDLKNVLSVAGIQQRDTDNELQQMVNMITMEL